MPSTEHSPRDEKPAIGPLIGIDTRLDIDKTNSQNQKLQSPGFLSFLEQVQTDLNAAVAVFVAVNGHDVQQLTADKTDINTLFADHEHYPDFVAYFAHTKAEIEHWIAADNPEPLAHQAIVDQVICLRAFIETRYAASIPEPDTPQKQQQQQQQRKVGHYLGAGIVMLPIIFAWFTLRKGYSNWLRIGAFLWLAVFLYATFPTANHDLKQSPQSYGQAPRQQDTGE
ncbi:hypothetical protein GCM10022421_13630 [Oceanisphaera sediminis]|uniref:Uncharacterized protein n=1 Tax=Oceanisphaera sediminis TaxID=981381 RepID=A0ABP7DQ68_9GAMM